MQDIATTWKYVHIIYFEHEIYYTKVHYTCVYYKNLVYRTNHLLWLVRKVRFLQ